MSDKSKLPPPILETSPRTAVRPDRKGYGVGRSSRREAEDIPAADYMAKIAELGQRDGESRLAFVKRLAAIRAGRQLVLQVWKLHKGNKAHVAAALLVPRNTLAYELRTIGLSSELLDAMLAKEVEINE